MRGRELIRLASCFLLAAGSIAQAQFSGYISGAYGFHQNPLYNYETMSDQLRQTYAELNYLHEWDASSLKFSYVSGLMVFNRFTERNYYEHNLWSKYSIAFRPIMPPPLSLSDDEGTPEIEAVAESTHDDSSGSFLEVGLKFGGRHDKTTYKEFDNFGSAAMAAYRFSVGDVLFLRVSNALDYRRYVYLAELSNLSDALAAQAGVTLIPSLSFGLRVGGGLKHYTSSLYDTLRFEEKRTYTVGKGKGGARLKTPSSKQLLLNAESDDILQLSMGAFLVVRRTQGTAGIEYLYRRNPGSPSRYLAQYVNTTILSDDIYNDHFAYEGPDVQIRVTQTLPLGVQSIWTVEHQHKRFGAPAVNLTGDPIANNRIDLRTSIELYLSKYFELTGNLGMDLALGAEIVRNQSNDVYNDFSHLHVSGSVGFGF